MKILVPVKRVIDYNVKPRGKSDGSGVDLANVKMSMNPFDEISVEEAIRLKAAGKAEEIVKNINDNSKSIRFELGTRVRHQLRIIPELKFFVDDSLDYVERIDELLKK